MSRPAWVVCALLLGEGAAEAKDAAIGLVSTTEIRTPDQDTSDLEHFGSGVGFSLLWLERNENLPAGMEVSTLFVVEGDARLFDLGISLLASLPVRERMAVPYLKVGLDLAGATIPPPDGSEPAADDSWVSLGVHGAAGLHGFLSEAVFWRAEAGWLGAGVGGLYGQLSIGWNFDGGR